MPAKIGLTFQLRTFFEYIYSSYEVLSMAFKIKSVSDNSLSFK